MTSFWISAALMVAVALMFFVPRLLRGPRISARELEQSAASSRQQLQSLEAAYRDGHVNKKDYKSRRQEISDTMMASLEDSPEPEPAARSPKVALALAFVLPLLTVFLYLEEGTPEAMRAQAPLQSSTQAPTPDHSAQPQAPELGDAIASLIARLERNPDDIDGWLLLGKSYMSMQNYQGARDALEKANDLAPNEPVIMVDYAESIAFTSGQRELPEQAVSLLTRAIELEPTAQKALWLLGLGAYQQGAFQAALDHWEQLLALLEPDSGVADTVIEQINNARQQLGMELLSGAPPTAAPVAVPAAVDTQVAAPPPAQNPEATRTLTVVVSLAAELSDRINSSDTLFIFARPAAGPKMPLAIRRLSAGQLPITVTLDDTMGMMPEMNLATFPQIVVGARISRSGDATPQPGDLQVLSDPLANDQQQPVRLEINSVL